jgi:hypothetical protein
LFCFLFTFFFWHSASLLFRFGANFGVSVRSLMFLSSPLIVAIPFYIFLVHCTTI